jgi:hypothetical protein
MGNYSWHYRGGGTQEIRFPANRNATRGGTNANKTTIQLEVLVINQDLSNQLV